MRRTGLSEPPSTQSCGEAAVRPMPQRGAVRCSRLFPATFGAAIKFIAICCKMVWVVGPVLPFRLARLAAPVLGPLGVCRRAKAALVEGNLANLEKLLRKGKTTPDVLEDRLAKVRHCRARVVVPARAVKGGSTWDH